MILAQECAVVRASAFGKRKPAMKIDKDTAWSRLMCASKFSWRSASIAQINKNGCGNKPERGGNRQSYE